MAAACGEDTALRAEVAALLAADAAPLPFLDQGAAAFLGDGWSISDDEEADDDDRELATGSLGPYRLLREIGRGGMSRVFLAERSDDQLRLRVAVKRL